MFALLLWFGAQTVMAQTKAKGRIIDPTGEGIPGAAVKVNGTATGTTTDVDGYFEIDVPEGSKITVSAIGYGDQTLTASGGMTVTMTTGDNVLVETVINAPYGPPITKEKYVGAADVVTGKQLENRPVTTLTAALEGATPGVQSTSTGGQPGGGGSGNLRIRGVGSLPGSSSTAPIIVLDGNVYDGDLASINVSDIESMTVLKDATSTSLYGSRGSNGVIVVTTKRGKKGERARINLDAKVGVVQRGLPSYNVMRDPKDYYEASWRALYNSLVTGGMSAADAGKRASGLTGTGAVDQLGYNNYHIPGVESELQNAYLLDSVTGKLNPNAQQKYASDDWAKAMQRTGLRQDYNLNVSGGSDKTDYYLSGGYLKEKGFLLNTDYERFSTRLNVNTQATDWLKFGMSMSAALSTQNAPSENSGTSSANPSYIALNTAPIYPVYYRDTNNNMVIDPLTGKDKYDYGSTVKDPTYSMGNRAVNPGDNIVGQMQLNENRTIQRNFTFSPYLEVKLPKNFSFKTTLTTNYVNYENTDWGTTLHGQFKTKTDTIPPVLGGALSKFNDNSFNYTWNQSLSWNKKIDQDHEISATAVHENYYYNETYLTGSNTGFPAENFRDLSVATGTPTSSSNTYNERLESYLGIVNYAYKGKYIFNANIRRDGLSRFYSDNRWGTFGAVGAAWIISDENFMKNVKWVNSLKLKASFGTQGNNRINTTGGAQNYYAWQGLYDVSRPNGGNSAAIPITLNNTNLKWESQKNLNIGTEFTLFNNILSGELNVYNRATSGLYYNVPFVPSTGFASKLQNAADMYNRGIELNVYVTPVRTSNFEWRFNANFSKFKNVLTKLADGVDSSIQSITMWKKGHSVYDYWVLHSDGVNSANGDELYSYTDASGNKKDTSDWTAAANSLRGRGYTGTSSIPALQGGFTNTLKYKGFQLEFLITYSIGGQFYDGTYQNLMKMETMGSNNLSPDVKNSWTVDNPTASLPRLELGNQDIGQVSDRWLVNASWLNIRNINLSYTFPLKTIGKMGFQSLTTYLSADNVYLFSARKGMNPQQSFGGTSDYLYVPSRIVTFGVRLGL